ncbi:hypothetical protein EV286_12018 [Rhizobium sp. BK251]|nr:hypothetical protein EV286_12018 [Rhizobium sp. BK251]
MAFKGVQVVPSEATAPSVLQRLFELFRRSPTRLASLLQIGNALIVGDVEPDQPVTPEKTCLRIEP